MYFDWEEHEQDEWNQEVIEGARILARMSASDRRKAVAILGAMSEPNEEEPPDPKATSTKGARH